MTEKTEGEQLRTAPQGISNNFKDDTKESQKGQSCGSYSHLLSKSRPPLLPPTKEEMNREARQVWRNGFHPIPKGIGKLCKAALYTLDKDGVRPKKGEVEYTEEFMDSQNFQDGYCIGTDNVTFLDFDCPTLELAEHMITFVLPRLDGGNIVRIGNSPKFSMPVRTDSQERDSTPSFYKDEEKNQFEILAGKAEHSAVVGFLGVGDRYQITTDNNFTNTTLEELPFVDAEMIKLFKDEFARKCLELGMTTREKEGQETQEQEKVKEPSEETKPTQRTIQGDIYTKVSMCTELSDAGSELEESGWAICEGIKRDGSYPTFIDQGRKYECLKMTRPGKKEGISAVLINYSDGLVLKVFTTSVPDLPVGAYKFAEAIKQIKHKGNSAEAIKDFVQRFGNHPFYKKDPSQDLLDSMEFGERADGNLLRKLQKLLKSKSAVTEALDWYEMGHKLEDLDKVFKESGLKMYNGQAFINMVIPETKYILSPIIVTCGLIMVTAKTGIGKTHFAYGCAIAAACGGRFLKYEAKEPLNVVYVDGEMSTQEIQQRFKNRINQLSLDQRALALKNFHLIAASEQELSIPCLSTPEGQQAIMDRITTDNTLLILDNVSTLIRNVGMTTEN